MAFIGIFWFYMVLLIWITPFNTEILNHINENKFWIVECKFLKLVFPLLLASFLLEPFVMIIKIIREGCVFRLRLGIFLLAHVVILCCCDFLLIRSRL